MGVKTRTIVSYTDIIEEVWQKMDQADREAVGPSGEHAHLIDNVIELRRK